MTSQKYKAIFDTSASVTAYIEVPEEVIAEATFDGELDEAWIEEWVADRAHTLASEHMQTWGIHQPVLLYISIDGIGAEEIEKVES